MWNLTFITEEDFTNHVKATIEKYGEKLESFDLKRFNKNIIDPIKLIFDKTVYQSSWEEIVSNEIFRQRDKSNNNDIGYFHQRIFQYIANCHVPPNGEEGGWDVIYENVDGVEIPDAGSVHTVYVEMKNKHNTMNSASAGKTFIKMQNQLLNDDDCACFLVEAIAQRSQNIKWETTVDKKKVGHKLIRRVSLDQFYALITGQEDAFHQMCMVLPSVIEKAVKDAEQFAEADKKQREEVDIRNGADQMIFQTEKTLKELDGKIDAADKGELETKLNALKEAVKGSNLDDIKAKQEDLQKKFYDVSAKLYQNVNPQAGQPGADAGAQPNNDDQNKDGFVDADFKEV